MDKVARMSGMGEDSVFFFELGIALAPGENHYAETLSIVAACD